MKVKIDKYTIDVNEETLKKSKKQSWVNMIVKSLEWTGIDQEILTTRFSEVYDIVKDDDKR